MLRVLYAVKAFLAQAKEEFNKKWEEAAQVSHYASLDSVSCRPTSLAALVFMVRYCVAFSYSLLFGLFLNND